MLQRRKALLGERLSNAASGKGLRGGTAQSPLRHLPSAANATSPKGRGFNLCRVYEKTFLFFCLQIRGAEEFVNAFLLMGNVQISK